MDVEGRTALVLGGSGLVGRATARRLLALGPARLVIGALRESEARGAVEELGKSSRAGTVELAAAWGDIFGREEHRERSRQEILADPPEREKLLEDLFAPMDGERYRHSALTSMLERHRPDLIVDCISTATSIAYQDLFGSARRLRRRLADADGVSREELETHLSTLYLPQLIRHIQLLLEGMRRAETKAYVKIGTSGTGGMGLNVPFTHSEHRPSGPLLAKASVAGAHSLLLFLMGRTPDGPIVKEIKPAAAIAWKRVGHGPIRRGGEGIPRFDSRAPVRVEEAFGESAKQSYEPAGGVVESVYLDAGENGYFSLSEFETISSLRMMEIVTPEEIADAALAEIQGLSTGRDIVGALDASVFGPTYRGGVLREAALRRMEELEAEHGVRSVAFEMLGPPRLSKLLYEAALLERLFPDLEAASELDPEETAEAAAGLIHEDETLRTDILSVGLPILLPDGKRLLRGPEVKAMPDGREAPDGVLPGEVSRWAAMGWVDLRPESWIAWRERCLGFLEGVVRQPGAEAGSGTDLDVRGGSGDLRAGALAAHVLKTEDSGERGKR